MQKLIAISELPSAGLGNKLFPWGAGVVFSMVNNCEHRITGLTKIHLGPLLRRERSKRFYFNFFKNEKIFDLQYVINKNKAFFVSQADSDIKVSKTGFAVFKEVPHWSDMFCTLRKHREIVIQSFWSNLSQRIKKRIEKHPLPIISVHIRMGDFKSVSGNQDFSKLGNVRTPLDYFVKTIGNIRKQLGQHCAVTIFSDGFDHELSEILSLPNVKRAEDDIDIVHLALMSKSKVIVMSAGSTFSYWAGFLSDAVLIHHFKKAKMIIRDEDTNSRIFEGGIDPNISELPELMVQNLKLLL